MGTDLNPVPRCVSSLLGASAAGQVHLAFPAQWDKGRKALAVVLRVAAGESVFSGKDQQS